MMEKYLWNSFYTWLNLMPMKPTSHASHIICDLLVKIELIGGNMLNKLKDCLMAAMVVGIMLSCENSTFTPPTGPSDPCQGNTHWDPAVQGCVPDNTSTVPVAPVDDFSQYPRVEVQGGILTVSGADLKAFTAFVLPIKSRAYSYALCIEAQSHGLNTARVFIEARNWTSAPGYLAQVAFNYDPEALEQVMHGMGEAGCAVQLVLNATAKEESRQAGLNLITQGINQFRDWPNVFYSLVNEYKHPSSVYDRADAKAFLRHADNLCPGCIIGLDEALRATTDFSHRACSSGRCDYIAWHPDRNDEAVENNIFFNRAVARSGGPVFFDELVAYATEAEMNVWPALQGRCTISLCGKGSDLERWNHANEVYNIVLDSGGAPCWHTVGHMLLLDDPAMLTWPQEH
jgi:hypothetical protein